MDFNLSETHKMIQQGIRKFCAVELDPIAEELDAEERFPIEVYKKAAREGFLGTLVPTEYGGSGADLLSMYIIKEEICRSSAGVGISFNICTLNFCHFISKFGTEEQKRRFLPRVARGEISAFATAGAAAVSCDGGPRAEVGTRAGFARALCRYWRGNLRDRHQLRAGAVDAGHARKYQYGIACACRLPLLRVAVAH